jgi:DNA polymerase-3 subunit alpha
MIICLIQSGAFDSFNLKRSQLIEIVEPTIKYASSVVKDRNTGQGSLFDFLEEEDQSINSIPVPDIPEFPKKEILEKEKELLGFYVTGHPIDEFSEILDTFNTASLRKVAEMENDDGMKFGAIIKTAQHRISQKSNKPYAILTLEDRDATMECMVFADKLEDCKDILVDDAVVFIEGNVSKDETGGVKIMASRVIPIEQTMRFHTSEIHLHIYEGSTKLEQLERIKALCLDNHKKDSTAIAILCLKCANGETVFIELPERYSVTIDNLFLKEIQNILGAHHYRLKADLSVPERKKRWTPKPQSEETEVVMD